jgi:hypothetical protein
MPKLIVTRPKEWMNGLRRYDLLLDDKVVERIKKNEIVELDIPAGRHTLKGRVDWCTSNEFDFVVSAEEIKYIKISGFKYSRSLIPALTLVIFLYPFSVRILLGRQHPEVLDYIFWAFESACGLFLIYLFTLGRKKYLWIRDDIK